MTIKWRIAAIFGAAMLLSACGSGTTLETKQLGSASVLASSADLRLVYAEPVDNSDAGRVKPRQVICAEPSADVAKAVSDAFGGSLEAQASGLKAIQGGDITADLALSHSRAEAIAQLGKRLATIQLLRDGLYRACEAYSNGAMSDISYALLLSRYGDTMVTLLGIEMVAGETAPPAAATAPPVAINMNAPTSSGTASPTSGSASPGTSQNITVNAGASPATVNPLSQPSLSNAQVAAIQAMQVAYLKQSKNAPLLVACVTALDKKDAATNEFAAFCKDHLLSLMSANSRTPSAQGP